MVGNLVINRDIAIPTLPDIPTGEYFNHILNQIEQVDDNFLIAKGEYLVSPFVSIRTTTTNKVMVVNNKYSKRLELGVTRSSIENIDPSLKGYYLCLAVIRDLLEREFHPVFRDAMPTSVLQPMGFIKDSFFLAPYFSLVVQDKYENGTFITNSATKSVKFEDISAVSTFTNLCPWSKIILPTLKVVSDKPIWK